MRRHSNFSPTLRALLLHVAIVGCWSLASACGKSTDSAKNSAASSSKQDTSKTVAAAPTSTGAATPSAAPNTATPNTAATEWEWQLPKGLQQPPPVPADNPMTAAKVELGHRLFMDKRLSGDNSRSCYSCHQNHLGNADGRAKALGAFNKELTRNSPTIWNVGYHREFYWDGRSKSLESQAIGALKGGNMGVGEDKLDAKASELAALPEYAASFKAVFGLNQPSDVKPSHVAMALSAYQRTLLCGDTASDRSELDESAKRGKELFSGKAACVVCHSGDNYSDGLYHNVGIGFASDGKPLPSVDVGRSKVTNSDTDHYKFRTPTLRNVSKTAPYFHDGSVATLEEAVRLMAKGGISKAPNIDPLLRNTGLSDAEIKDLVAFLQALACPGTLQEIGDQRVDGIAPPPV